MHTEYGRNTKKKRKSKKDKKRIKTEGKNGVNVFKNLN